MRRFFVLLLAVLVLSGCAASAPPKWFTGSQPVSTAVLQELTAEKIESFRFQIGGFGIMNEYQVNKKDLTLTMELRESKTPTAVTQKWNQQKWDSFTKDILACGIASWESVYKNEQIVDGTQWRLELTGAFKAVTINGSNNAPEEWKEFLGVLTRYFGVKVQ